MMTKHMRPGWELAVRRIARASLRPWPAALVLAAIERTTPRYARLALRARGGLPRSVRAFPARVAPYLGTDPGPEERRRLIEGRLVFLLIRSFLNQLLLVHGAAGARRELGPIELRGTTHLDAALAEQRGLILVSAHFGLPALIRLAIEERGLPVVGVGGMTADGVDVVVGRDVWTAARGMQRVRDALADRQVCVLLVDTRRGRSTPSRFLHGQIHVAPGAFRLAQLSGSPLLPIFAIHTGADPRFRVEIGPALPAPDRPGPSAFAETLAEFVRCYEAAARDHPAQLFAYERVFGASSGRSAPRPGEAPEPRSRSARP